MKDLHLASDLALPASTVTQNLAFLARRGAGKTYAAGKLAEELLGAGAQVVVVDPIGNWYGLRIGAGGKGKGFEIPVLGGEFGDLALVPESGALIADLAVESGQSLVLDVSSFRKEQRKRFVTDFAEQLLQRKKTSKSAMHLILEEAQLFVPQRVMHGEERMLGAMEDLVKLGRNYGIGVTLISQRPQSVNKDALNQTEILVVLQTTGPQERAAIEGWIEDHGLEAQTKDAMRELPSLRQGEAWVWSPSFLRILKKVTIGKKRTFDASATPELGAGQTGQRARKLVPVDLAALQDRMSKVTAQAAEADPRVLRARVKELEAELVKERAKKVPAAAPAKAPKRVEVPVLNEAVAKRIERSAERALEQGKQLIRDFGDAWRETKAAFDALRTASAAPAPLVPAERPGSPAAPAKPAARSEQAPRIAGLVGGAVRMLHALAAFPGGLLRTQLGTLTGMSPSSGTFGNYLSQLRTLGFVEAAGDRLRLTTAGLEAAGGARPRPSVEEVRGMWRPKLVGKGREMFDHLIAIAPAGLTRDELAEAVGASAGSGTFGNYLSTLRSNNLIRESGGQIFAADELAD